METMLLMFLFLNFILLGFIMAQVQDILIQVAQVSATIDQVSTKLDLVVLAPLEDLQPVVDAVAGLQVKADAALAKASALVPA